ncbi:glycosyltransferase family 4 protein [Cryomorphaceae bacterium]|nr:glycosyltransferase family 4 protein [Cryomorphaceae bacterium]
MTSSQQSIALLVTRFPYGGAEVQAAHLARRLIELGVSAKIVAIANPKGETEIDGLPVRGLGLVPCAFGTKRLLRFAGYNRRLLLELKKGGFDTVISFPQNYFLGWLAPKGLNTVLSIRIFYPNVLSPLRRWLLQHYDLVLTNNLPQYSLLNALNIEAEYVNNSVDIHRAVEAPRLEKTFLLVANIKRRKNIDVAVEAFNRLEDRGYKIQIVGEVEDDGYMKELRSAAHDNIEFLGRLSKEDVHELIQRCDALIHPTEREGAANVILEAMALHTPVIASRIPENVALLENSNHLFTLKDSEDLERAVVRFVELREAAPDQLYAEQSFLAEKVRLFYHEESLDRLVKMLVPKSVANDQ